MSLPQAPYLPVDYIEKEIEYHLNCARLLPNTARPIDIEAFLEIYLRAHVDQHAELESDVLGYTCIPPGEPPHVFINRDLTLEAEEDTSPLAIRGRWRMTWAHEGCHIIFHGSELAAAAQQPSLFDLDPPSNVALARQVCLKRDFGQVKKKDRREIQADLGMAALLMPRSLFEPAAHIVIKALKPLTLSPEQRLFMMVEQLAPQFEVSRTAARIRVETFSLHTMRDQDQFPI